MLLAVFMLCSYHDRADYDGSKLASQMSDLIVDLICIKVNQLTTPLASNIPYGIIVSLPSLFIS